MLRSKCFSSLTRISLALLRISFLFVPFLRAASQELVPASPPIATPEDAARFSGVHEDWSTPSLDKSVLLPARPLIATVDERADYTLQLIQVQWRAADPIDLYIIRPKGMQKPPVVLYLYGYPSETDRFQDPDFQKLATKGGFAAVGFMTALTGHRYHDRPMAKWFISELQESLATSAHDVQMILNYLSTRDDLDMSRVGVFGQGSGASIAILAAAVDSRIKAVDALDPWADWPDWFAKSAQVPEDERPLYLKPSFLDKVAPLDPMVWLPQIRSSKFRLEDAQFIQSTPAICKEKLKAVMPSGAISVTYKSKDDFQAEGEGGKILDWIKAELNAPVPSQK